MKAPTCPTCGKTEWRHLCAGAAQPVERTVKPTLSKPKRPVVLAAPKPAAKIEVRSPAAIAVKKRAPRGTFDRTAYQREYMRKRKAALNPQKP